MRRALLVVLVLLTAFAVSSCIQKPPDLGTHRKLTLQKHNEKRRNHGVARLHKYRGANNQALYTATRIASESAGGCILRHTDGNQLLAWYNAAVAENIACVYGCIDSRTAFRQFWNSPPHRANILNGGYHRIGIGIQCYGSMSYFAIHYVS